MGIAVRIDFNLRDLRNAYPLVPTKCFDRAYVNVINRAGTEGGKETVRQFKRNSFLISDRTKQREIFQGRPIRANATRSLLTWKRQIRNRSHNPTHFTTATQIGKAPSPGGGVKWKEYNGAPNKFVRRGFLVQKTSLPSIDKVDRGKARTLAFRRAKGGQGKVGRSQPKSQYNTARSGYVNRLTIRKINASSHETIFRKAGFEKPVFDAAENKFNSEFLDEIDKQLARGTCTPKFGGAKRGIVNAARLVFRSAA